jgi:hypothetical protein
VASIKTPVQSELTWPSRLGASSPRAVSFPGISVPAATRGTGPCAVVSNSAGAHAVPRLRGKAAFAALLPQTDVVATLLGQTNIHNYMTRAYAVGEGASGPPPEPPDSKPV